MDRLRRFIMAPSQIQLFDSCGSERHTFLKMFLAISCFMLLFQGCQATCTYPLDGVFHSSHEGNITWNSTAVGTFSIVTITQTFSDLVYECVLNSGDYYVGRSQSFQIFGVEFYAYICFRLHRLSDNVYYYYYGATEVPGAAGARVKIVAKSSSVTSVSTVCDEPTPYDPGSFSILYKNGADIATEASTCPTALQGYFTYTIDDGSTTHCANGSHLDVCVDSKQLIFNYTECNDTSALYSAGGQLHCLYSETSGSYTYLILYNDDANVDGSTTYRTTCLLYESGSGGTVYATQYPNECANSTLMNSTAVVSPGASIVLMLNESCPVSTTSTTTTTTTTATSTAEAVAQSSTGAIVGGSLGAFAIIAVLAVVIVGVLWYKKKLPSKIGKSDDKAAIIPTGNGEVNSRTLFTPTNKIPNGRESGEILSDRQITLINVSSDDIDAMKLSEGESLTDEYGEIQADEIVVVSDPTVISNDQMTEASLPMFSEGGDSPKPTTITPPGVVNNEPAPTSQPNTARSVKSVKAKAKK